MNAALPDEHHIPEATVSTGAALTSVALYIDADNQSPQCAKALLSLLRTDFDAHVVSAAIAGNNHGQQVDSWREGLASALPDLVVRPLTVPHRKQGADVALILALGADLERHIRDHALVIIVSRDDLVIGAAEQAKMRGCRTLIAYADGDIATARNQLLTTILLPALAKPITVVQPRTVVVQSPTTILPDHRAAQSPGAGVEAVLKQIRSMCTQKPGGGYSATDVGQALSKLGYDKAARMRFLASLSGLKKRGTGPNLILVF
ncbi:NYN domain-containing protein [uncultured Lamprocystis sp.]|jgi:hypothetical protein|uniref:NYN domain-containing protein n=1 Tax=uncultured Lamprocystis sp. TaxID=543132 RepID=UPI0025D609F0|nr:NYN domain-containing protein [uncultured Lamprocystis sp.]